jgi:hypothetical protein
MSQRERYKVTLQIVVTSDRAFFSDHQQFLVLGPSKAAYRAFIPLLLHQFWAINHAFVRPYIQPPNELPSATVYVDTRLSGLRAAVRMDAVFVSVERYLSPQNVSIR